MRIKSRVTGKLSKIDTKRKGFIEKQSPMLSFLLYLFYFICLGIGIEYLLENTIELFTTSNVDLPALMNLFDALFSWFGDIIQSVPWL